jgi:hypothetical protein
MMLARAIFSIFSEMTSYLMVCPPNFEIIFILNCTTHKNIESCEKTTSEKNLPFLITNHK